MRKGLLIGLLVLSMAVLAGCNQTPAEQPATTAPQMTTQPAATEPQTTTQPAQVQEAEIVSFTNIAWTREAENDTETLRFADDGSFYYSCACGDPVNDADLCEGYRYDEETKTIYLEYLETTEETITQITVESCDGSTLVLNFDGQLRTFQVKEETPA